MYGSSLRDQRPLRTFTHFIIQGDGVDDALDRAYAKVVGLRQYYASIGDTAKLAQIDAMEETGLHPHF